VDATAIHETEQIFFIRHEDLDDGKLKTRRGGKGKGQRLFDDELGGVRRAVVQAPGRVHSAPELDDGVEEEVRGDLHRLQGVRETPAMMERKVGAKRRQAMGSSSHNTPVLCVLSLRIVSS
jgi:hypothetical protein